MIQASTLRLLALSVLFFVTFFTTLAPAVERLQPSAHAPQNTSDRVDIALVLAVDVSSSIETSERLFQRQAYAAALSDLRVANIAFAGEAGRVAIAYMEWSGKRYQRVHLPMRVLTTPEELAAFGAEIMAIPDRPSDPMYMQPTALGDALLAAETAMATFTGPARDYVIDISGDGVMNDGFAMQTAREHVLARGMTVNGLPIEMSGNPENMNGTTVDAVSRYYADCVIGGPGAFHLVARGFEDIRETLIMKLMLEMAALPPKEKRRMAAAWNMQRTVPEARIVPAMVIELQPAKPHKRSSTDCANGNSPLIIP
ncbi:MAG: DUF1194 domain-containing protein [Pseudomonadota bacterium]